MDFKYKIADVAKEFGMPAKKVVETVSGVTGEAYKTAGTFEEKELNVLLETLTRENAEDSLDAYLASGKEPAPAPKAEKKPEPKKAEAPKPAAQPAQQQPFLQSAGQHGSGHSRPHCRRHTGHRPHCGQWQPCMRQQKRRQRQQQYAHAHAAAKGQQQRRHCWIFNAGFWFAQIFSHNKTPPCTVNTMQGGVGFMSITS